MINEDSPENCINQLFTQINQIEDKILISKAVSENDLNSIETVFEDLSYQINQLNFDLLDSSNRVSTVRRYEKKMKSSRVAIDSLITNIQSSNSRDNSFTEDYQDIKVRSKSLSLGGLHDDMSDGAIKINFEDDIGRQAHDEQFKINSEIGISHALLSDVHSVKHKKKMYFYFTCMIVMAALALMFITKLEK